MVTPYSLFWGGILVLIYLGFGLADAAWVSIGIGLTGFAATGIVAGVAAAKK